MTSSFTITIIAFLVSRQKSLYFGTTKPTTHLCFLKLLISAATSDRDGMDCKRFRKMCNFPSSDKLRIDETCGSFRKITCLVQHNCTQVGNPCLENWHPDSKKVLFEVTSGKAFEHRSRKRREAVVYLRVTKNVTSEAMRPPIYGYFMPA